MSTTNRGVRLNDKNKKKKKIDLSGSGSYSQRDLNEAVMNSDDEEGDIKIFRFEENMFADLKKETEEIRLEFEENIQRRQNQTLQEDL